MGVVTPSIIVSLNAPLGAFYQHRCLAQLSPCLKDSLLLIIHPGGQGMHRGDGWRQVSGTAIPPPGRTGCCRAEAVQERLASSQATWVSPTPLGG